MKLLIATALAVICLAQLSHQAVRNSDLAKRAELQRALLLKRGQLRRKTVPEIIEKHGYPAEKHTVQTADGYLLEVHRVPHARGRPNSVTKGVALLMHGLFSSSADFLVSGDKSLGFFLSEAGYDVWLGNHRGNTNSKNHVSLNPSQSAFWQFSWNEMGNFDSPAIIDYVLAVTGEEKLHYISHSQGGTSFYVMGADRPEYNAKIRSSQALAPAGIMKHQPNILLHIISLFEEQLDWVASIIGLNEFLPSMKIIEDLGKLFCKDEDWTQGILCTNIYFMIAGYNPDQLNATLIPEILENVPAGAATKQLLHFAQGIRSGHFQKYDFGWMKNNQIYGQSFPPDYDLKKVTAPTYIYYADNDNMVSSKDIEHTAEFLPNVLGLYKTNDKLWGHIDFLMGIDAIELVYKQILANMEKH